MQVPDIDEEEWYGSFGRFVDMALEEPEKQWTLSIVTNAPAESTEWADLQSFMGHAGDGAITRCETTDYQEMGRVEWAKEKELRESEQLEHIDSETALGILIHLAQWDQDRFCKRTDLHTSRFMYSIIRQTPDIVIQFTYFFTQGYRR